MNLKVQRINGKFNFWATLMLGILAIGLGMSAQAQPSDITGVIGAVSGYATAAIAVGVVVLLFVLGRTVVRKLAK